ncbi:MAG TPA: cyanophycinase [Longimicrobiales bacterium]|nr:cyanophycinase [Longimicrobiales bacterium]
MRIFAFDRAARPLVIALVALSTGTAVQAQGRLVIIGGGLSRENEAVYRSILDARQGTGQFCIIPTAAANAAEGFASAVTSFDRHGGTGTAVPVVIDVQKPETARDAGIVAQIERCSGFFFVGGVQSRVINALLPNGERTPTLDALLRRYRDGAVIAGSSAGAAIMSDPMIAGGTSAGAIANGVRRASGDADDDDGPGGVSITRGIGFFPHALVDQHFLARGRIGRLIVAVDELTEFDLGFGIDENTALVTEGTTVWPVGASGVVVLDARDAHKQGSTLSNLRVHLMGSGDRYDVATRTLAIDPAKTALPPSTGTVNAPEDVFARWQFLQLLNAFARTQQRELTIPIEGGTVVLRKTAEFAARSAAGTGVQDMPAALSITGLTLQLRLDR